MEHNETHYVDKQEMYKELVEYNKTGVISDKLHHMWYAMAVNIATMKKFRDYTYIDDMITEAYMRCIHYANKFKVDKSREPFSYFTTTIIRSFIAHVKKEKKYQLRKWNELRGLIEKMEHEYQITLDLNDNLKEKIYSYTDERVTINDDNEGNFISEKTAE